MRRRRGVSIHRFVGVIFLWMQMLFTRRVVQHHWMHLQCLQDMLQLDGLWPFGMIHSRWLFLAALVTPQQAKDLLVLATCHPPPR